MKIATLDLTPELFVEFCKASGDRGGVARKFVVEENPLPEDAEVVAVEAVKTSVLGLLPPLRLIIQSASFSDVEDYQSAPELPRILYRTIFDHPE